MKLKYLDLFAGIGGFGIDCCMPVIYTVDMANKYTKVRPDIKLMIKLYQSGMTQKETAEEMNLTQKIVWRCLRDAKIKCRVAAKRNQRGILNSSWRGNNASYAAFHYRMYALKGSPKNCQICKTSDLKKHYDWANLTGKYEDPKDYKRMCRSCHWKNDRIIKNLGAYAK